MKPGVRVINWVGWRGNHGGWERRRLCEKLEEGGCRGGRGRLQGHALVRSDERWPWWKYQRRFRGWGDNEKKNDLCLTSNPIFKSGFIMRYTFCAVGVGWLWWCSFIIVSWKWIILLDDFTPVVQTLFRRIRLTNYHFIPFFLVPLCIFIFRRYPPSFDGIILSCSFQNGNTYWRTRKISPTESSHKYLYLFIY